MAGSAARRQNDVMKLMMSDFDVIVDEDKGRGTLEFTVKNFKGPVGSGLFTIGVHLPSEYPFKSPSIGFRTRIFHPNIDERSGSVCLDVINQSWSPMYDLVNIFETFLPQLLTYGNAADPLNGEAAALMLRDPDKFKQRVKEYIARHCVVSEGKLGSQGGTGSAGVGSAAAVGRGSGVSRQQPPPGGSAGSASSSSAASGAPAAGGLPSTPAMASSLGAEKGAATGPSSTAAVKTSGNSNGTSAAAGAANGVVRDRHSGSAGAGTGGQEASSSSSSNNGKAAGRDVDSDGVADDGDDDADDAAVADGDASEMSDL